MAQLSKILMNDPDFLNDIELIAAKMLALLRPLSVSIESTVNQEATPDVHYHPVGIHFDDDTHFQCFMLTAERERLHKDFFAYAAPDQPYAFKASLDLEEPVRWLALRIGDIHHLY